MSRSDIHDGDMLARYAFGEVGGTERSRVEDHLTGCASCQDFVSFATEFNNGLGAARQVLAEAQEACPDTSLIVDLEAGELAGETAQHVHAHVLFCGSCREEFYALRRLRTPSWAKVVINAIGKVFECASLIGSARLVEPAYESVRAGQVPHDYVELEDRLMDPDTGEASTVRVLVEPVGRGAGAVRLHAEPAQPSWTVMLLDAAGSEIAASPLSEADTLVASGLPYARYTLNVAKNAHTLASVAMTIQGASPS